MLQLSRHGYYAIERTVYGVRLTIREGLNQEAVAEYGLDMTKHLLELEGRLWGMLLIVEHDAMLTPEGGRRLQQTIQPQFSMGRCATAILLRECRASALVSDFWSRIYQSSNLPFQLFTQESEAQSWLEAQIRLTSQHPPMDAISQAANKEQDTAIHFPDTAPSTRPKVD